MDNRGLCSPAKYLPEALAASGVPCGIIGRRVTRSRRRIQPVVVFSCCFSSGNAGCASCSGDGGTADPVVVGALASYESGFAGPLDDNQEIPPHPLSVTPCRGQTLRWVSLRHASAAGLIAIKSQDALYFSILLLNTNYQILLNKLNLS